MGIKSISWFGGVEVKIKSWGGLGSKILSGVGCWLGPKHRPMPMGKGRGGQIMSPFYEINVKRL